MSGPLIKLCRASDVPEGGALKVESGDLVLAVFNLVGNYYVIDDHCTHGPGSLSEGFVDGDEIECDFHNGRYHIPTGAVTAPPCMLPVHSYIVHVVGDEVCIEHKPKPLALTPVADTAPG